MKHLLHTKIYGHLLSTYHGEKFIQAPVNKDNFNTPNQDFNVGDKVIVSHPNGMEMIEITSKKNIKIKYPSPFDIYDDEDVISAEITGLKNCYLNNKCRTIDTKTEFIEKHYPKIFNEIWGKKSFKVGADGFLYGFKETKENLLNHYCRWTRIESKDADYSTTCNSSFADIGEFKFCPTCGGEIKDVPLFHIDVTDRYSELLQQIKDDLYRNEDDIHRFTDTLVFIDKMVKNYNELLGFPKEEILEAFESKRKSWSANHYQIRNFPQPFLNDVNIYDSIEDLRKVLDKEKGFRCGSCGKTSDHESICSHCKYNINGFLSVGKDYRAVIKNSFLDAPVVYKIFVPVCLEVV